MAEQIHTFFCGFYQEMIQNFVDFMLIDFAASSSNSTTKNVLERRKTHILQNLKSYKTIEFFDKHIDNLQINVDFITNDKDMLQIVADIFNSKDHETFMAKQKEKNDDEGVPLLADDDDDDEYPYDDEDEHSESSSWERYELADYGKCIYIVDTEILNENGEYKILTKTDILKKYLIEVLFVNDKDRQKTRDYIATLLGSS